MNESCTVAIDSNADELNPMQWESLRFQAERE